LVAVLGNPDAGDGADDRERLEWMKADIL